MKKLNLQPSFLIALKTFDINLKLRFITQKNEVTRKKRNFLSGEQWRVVLIYIGGEIQTDLIVVENRIWFGSTMLPAIVA